MLLELDVEPRAQVRGSSDWWTLAATPMVEIYPCEWLDMTVESTVAYTLQRPSVRSVEMSQRAGARLYPLQLVGVALPKSRLTMADWVHVEWRGFEYFGSEGETTPNDRRLRNRIELRVGFDAAGSTEPQPLYLMADWEAFLLVGPRATERGRLASGSVSATALRDQSPSSSSSSATGHGARFRTHSRRTPRRSTSGSGRSSEPRVSW